MKSMVARGLAEAIGTAAIVLFGCGSIALAQTQQSHAAFIPVVFGLVVLVMIYAFGHVSGAHFNPAVTIAFASVRRFAWRDVPWYLFFQFAGALVGAASVGVLFPNTEVVGETIPGTDHWTAVLWEIILTYMLMLVVVAVATDSRATGMMAGVAIGSIVALDAYLGGSFTGASMNPARSLGPAVVSGEYTGLWIYFAGPIVGALLGALTYELIREEKSKLSKLD